MRSGVVKIRGAFKQWTKRYCVLRPGWLFHYDDSSMDPKDSGKINIANCTVEFRDSKKTVRIFAVVAGDPTCLPGFVCSEV